MSTIDLPFWHPCLSSGFILDWDGVLADTNLDFSGIRAKFFNGRRVPLIEAKEWLSEQERGELWKDIYDLEMEGAARAVPVKGAFELVDWLNSNDVPWSVVSRNCMDSIRLAASNIGITLPEVTLSRDSGPVKPDPRALWLAADKMGVRRGECVMVGDFIYDIIGARRAAMRGVLVERTDEDWNVWADVCFDTMVGMVSSLDRPEPVVPWEYHELAEHRGREWLAMSWKKTLGFPDDDPDLASRAFEAASLGVGAISVRSDINVSMVQWKRWAGARAEYMGMNLAGALGDFLREHYPMVRITTEDVEGVRPVAKDRSIISILEEGS